jgi:hypothetical protein
MAKRNDLFRKVTDLLVADGHEAEDATRLAREAVQSRMKGDRGPVGHGSLTRTFEIVDDACQGYQPTCNSTSRYRTKQTLNISFFF